MNYATYFKRYGLRKKSDLPNMRIYSKEYDGSELIAYVETKKDAAINVSFQLMGDSLYLQRMRRTLEKKIRQCLHSKTL